MLRRIIHSKRGEGYVDVCVGVIAFVMVLVIGLNIFEFINLRVEMDQIADELIEAVTYSGEFGNDFIEADNTMLNDYYWYALDWGAERYFNTALERVQLGDRMWVKISVQTYIKGLGIKIPITLTVKKSGLSEKYWK